MKDAVISQSAWNFLIANSDRPRTQHFHKSVSDNRAAQAQHSNDNNERAYLCSAFVPQSAEQSAIINSLILQLSLKGRLGWNLSLPTGRERTWEGLTSGSVLGFSAQGLHKQNSLVTWWWRYRLLWPECNLTHSKHVEIWLPKQLC